MRTYLIIRTVICSADNHQLTLEVFDGPIKLIGLVAKLSVQECHLVQKNFLSLGELAAHHGQLLLQVVNEFLLGSD